MKPLTDYITEAMAPQTGIGAFDWQIGGNHVIINNIIQQLKAHGFTPTSGNNRVKYKEYKVTHNGSCLTIGLKGIRKGDSKEHTHKVFIRQDSDGMIDIITKHYDPDGSGTWFTGWLIKHGDIEIGYYKSNDLPRKGTIEDTAENSVMILNKILTRSKRFGK